MDHEKWLEQHDRMMADHELWLARHEEAAAHHDREMAEIRESQRKTEETLRRAIRLGVRDARRQRQRNLEFEERMSQIAALLKTFLERSGNGKH